MHIENIPKSTVTLLEWKIAQTNLHVFFYSGIHLQSNYVAGKLM